jgi:hypothetical protein
MSDGATANYFYKLGCLAALAKVGASLERPEDQTFQVHREVGDPATNGPDGRPADKVDYTPGSTQDLWNEHDRRVQLGVLPDIDSRTGL